MSFNNRFRPRLIEDVIGNQSIRTALTTLLDKNKLPKIVIFNGGNGIGKTSLAYAVTHRLMCDCEQKEDEVEVCEVTRQLWGREELSLSTNIHEIDLGKDRDDLFIDTVVDLFRIKGKKTIILDEIQNISPINMVKFLKTMDNIDEETNLIICTTELHRLDTGIISRSEVFTLTPPTVVELATHLEGICRTTNNVFSRDGILMIAKHKYRVRDAVRSLETVLDIYGEVTLEGVREYFGKSGTEDYIKFLEATKESSPYKMLFLLDEVQKSIGIYKFMEGFKEFVLNVIYIKNGIKPQQYLEEEIYRIDSMVELFNEEEIYEILTRVESISHKSNMDRQIGLVNMGLAISGGRLFQKVSPTENKAVERKVFEPKFDESKVLGEITGGSAFDITKASVMQIDKGSEYGLEDIESPLSNEDLEDIMSIFNTKEE